MEMTTMRQRNEPGTPGMEAAGMVRFEVDGQTVEIFRNGDWAV